MIDYWVGKRTIDDEPLLVFDPSVQISDTHVYLFNMRSGRIGEFERIQARNTIRKVVNQVEIQSAIDSYYNWLNTEAGRHFTRLIQRIQNGPSIPRSLHKYYRMGYQDGFAGYIKKDFNERTPELCRREYNRGYIDGLDDSTVEQELHFLGSPDEVDEWYFLENNLDVRTTEDEQQQNVVEERVYQNRLKRDRAKRTRNEYNQYLKSNHWLLVKLAALIRANFQCESCGKQEHLEVHHKTYERRNEETSEDVMVLCRRCHEDKHS